MKLRYLVMACSLLIVTKGSAAPATAQQPAAGDLAPGLHHGFTEVSGWVTKAAELVPADKYSYRPVGSVRTFGQQIAHIADAYNYYCATAAGRKVQWSDAIEKGSHRQGGARSKAQAVNRRVQRGIRRQGPGWSAHGQHRACQPALREHHYLHAHARTGAAVQLSIPGSLLAHDDRAGTNHVWSRRVKLYGRRARHCVYSIRPSLPYLVPLMHTFLHDFRYALRTLRRSAGLTFVIVASLAIGIGANTAIFSVVNALLLKPLPYPDPDRLAILWLRSPGINIPQDWPSPGQYIDIQTGEPLVRRDVHLAGPERNVGGAGSTGTRGGPAHVFQPVPSAGRPAALRPPAAPGGRHTRQAGRRGPEPRLLEAPVQLRSERRRPGHRPERHHRRDGIGQEPVHGRRRPAAGLRAERRDHADRGQHQADGHLPAASTRGGRRHPQRRRELQPHGAPEAGCDDGAGAGGHQRHRGTHSRQGQARQDVHHQRRPAARSGRRRRPPGHARAARRRGAGAADRLRQRREPAADARQRPPEGSGDPHGARRRVAAPRAAAVDGKPCCSA